MTVYKIRVPNEYRPRAPILFVGESPGEEEEIKGSPFIGVAGQKLTQTCERVGISREMASYANLCQYRPAGNKFEILFNNGQLHDRLLEGLGELYHWIRENKPTLIVPLGNYPMFFLTGKGTKKNGKITGISAYRGSILTSIVSGAEDVKCIPTFHPSAITHKPTDYPVFLADMDRVAGDSKFRELRLPEREFIIDPRGAELANITDELCESEHLSVDIESVKGSGHIICVGFSPRPNLAVCIANHQDPSINHSIGRILAGPSKKTFQFGTFDTTVLQNAGFTINNYYWDTLVAQHILNPELPRSLDFLTSIYTRQPYYKASGRGEIPKDQKSWGSKTDKQKLYEYNCKDAAVTTEIRIAQEVEIAALSTEMQELFKFELEEIEIAVHISEAGLPIDVERRAYFRDALFTKWYRLQAIVDAVCGQHVNVNSPKLKDLVYGKFGLPARRKRGGGVTTDEDAIIATLTFIKGKLDSLKRADAIAEWNLKYAVLKAILEIRGLRKLLSTYINNKISADNCFRSTWKVAGPETGRWACEQYYDGTGGNAQTFPRGIIEVPERMIAAAKSLEQELEHGSSEDEAESDYDGDEQQAA
jgi:uracil-DNA glycosylase family 4